MCFPLSFTTGKFHAILIFQEFWKVIMVVGLRQTSNLKAVKIAKQCELDIRDKETLTHFLWHAFAIFLFLFFCFFLWSAGKVLGGYLVSHFFISPLLSSNTPGAPLPLCVCVCFSHRKPGAGCHDRRIRRGVCARAPCLWVLQVTHGKFLSQNVFH